VAPLRAEGVAVSPLLRVGNPPGGHCEGGDQSGSGAVDPGQS
jgi:hypothetical protein